VDEAKLLNLHIYYTIKRGGSKAHGDGAIFMYNNYMKKETKKLYRSKSDRVLFGICGGIAKYFNVDATLIRILFLLLALSGIGILFYIALALIIPEDPTEQIEGDREHAAKKFIENIGHNAQKIAHELKHGKNWWSDSKNVLGIIVLVIGVILLAQVFFPIIFMPLHMLLPIVVIGIGLYFLVRKK